MKESSLSHKISLTHQITIKHNRVLFHHPKHNCFPAQKEYGVSVEPLHNFLIVETTKKVLIIEDEKTLAKALELTLTHAGFSVVSVFNGKDGILLLEQSAFDIILLDLMMPKVDGFAVLRALHKQQITTPVMMLSNLNQENYILKAKELGAKDFLIKSDTPIAAVIERVRQLVLSEGH